MLFSSSILTSRLTRLREKIQEKNLDALLISSDQNRYYLTGWQGDEESGYLFVSAKKAFVITDSRYTEEVVQQIPHFELREFGRDEKFWGKLFLEVRVKRVGFEAKNLSVFNLLRFKKTAKVRWFPTLDLVETLRAVKDEEEIKLVSKAASICDQAFKFVLDNIKVGQAEKEIAWEMEEFMRKNGAEKNAWNPFIVASGPNSSKVHYGAGERKVKKGDQILLDWGCYFHGYASDISRVVFLGTPTKKQVEVYKLVLEAQMRGIEQVKVNNSNKNVDLAAREFLQTKTKFTFGHAVGHGVGLAVHELPHVNSKTKEKFQIGNIITVEPGIYEPGWGGVRIEDMILVTEKGARVLTKAPKEINQVTLD